MIPANPLSALLILLLEVTIKLEEVDEYNDDPLIHIHKDLFITA